MHVLGIACCKRNITRFHPYLRQILVRTYRYQLVICDPITDANNSLAVALALSVSTLTSGSEHPATFVSAAVYMLIGLRYEQSSHEEWTCRFMIKRMVGFSK